MFECLASSQWDVLGRIGKCDLVGGGASLSGL